MPDEKRHATEPRRQEVRRATDQHIVIETGHLTPGAPVRVGRRLPGVHLGSLESRAGMPLEAQVAEVIRQVETQDPPIEGPEDLTGHSPGLAAANLPGAWAVFCQRCSHEQEDWVYPCKVDPSGWPPALLYESGSPGASSGS